MSHTNTTGTTRLVEIPDPSGRLAIYETTSPAPADGVERQLLGTSRLVGFTLPVLGGPGWEAHWRDGAGRQSRRAADTAKAAAEVLRAALAEEAQR